MNIHAQPESAARQSAAAEQSGSKKAARSAGPVSPLVQQQMRKIAELTGAVQAPAVAQRQTEEEKTLQGRFEPAKAAQRAESEEEKEPVQGRFDSAAVAQRAEPEEEKEPVQGRFEAPLQRKAEASNRTGLPDALKSGVENLSGLSLDSVKVHYNSDKPTQLNALAYTQGSDIHVAPGQEKHLPHEAWHVVQQAQGRVEPTLQMAEGTPVNDDAGLEHEADVMGGKALG